MAFSVQAIIENSLRGEDTELNTEDIEDFFKAADALGIQMSSLWKDLTRNRYSEYKGKKANKMQVVVDKNEVMRDTETVKAAPNMEEEENLYDEKSLEIYLDEEIIENHDVMEESLPHEDPSNKDDADSLQEDQEENRMDTDRKSPGLSQETEATPSLTSEAGLL